MPISMNRGWGYASARPPTPNTTEAPLGLAPGATVTVFSSGTVTPILIYADRLGMTPLANPFDADINAYFDFYCLRQRVDVQFSGTGITSPYTLGDFLVLDQSPIYYNVCDYGATGNGSNNDAPAVQAAINDCSNNGGGIVWFPAGAYYCAQTLTITTSGVTLRGAGMLTSTIIIAGATQTGIAIAAALAIEISDLQIACAVPHMAGAGITVIGTTAAPTTQFCKFSRIFCQSLFNGLVANAMAYSLIEQSVFNNCGQSGVTIQNMMVPDAGDNTVYACDFFSNVVNLFYESSGGLRVSDCKFLGGTYGFLMALSEGIATGDLLIEGNSFEGMTAGTLLFESNGSPTPGTYVNVAIVGNQFGGQSTLTVNGVVALGSGVNPGWFNNITVTDNIITLAINGQIGIAANVGSNNGTIDGNVIIGSGNASVGIGVQACASNWTVGPNNSYYAVFGSLVANASTSTRVEPYVYNAHSAWTPGTIAPGGSVSAVVGVLNAAFGDPVVAGLSTLAGAAVVLFASVSGASVVTVTAYNPTGAPITLGAGTLNVTLFHQLSTVGT
jgi:Pectate lyase superfamily protein